MSTGGSTGRFDPAIGGHIVAWESGSLPWNLKLYAYNLDTETEFIVAGMNYSHVEPDVSNDGAVIVWESNRDISEDFDIWKYDVADQTESPVAQIAESHQRAPAISDAWIVWEDERNGAADIYGINRGGGSDFSICSDASVGETPAVSGDIVVWVDWRNADSGNPDNADIYGYDLDSSTEFPICTNSSEQFRPAVSGRFVVWQDLRNDGGSWTNSDIYGYDLVSQSEFSVCLAEGNQSLPEIDGRRVVWQDGRRGGGSSDVYSRYLMHIWHDACESAIPVEQDRIYEGSSLYATGSEVSGCSSEDTADVWHRFIPKINGEYTISLMGSSFDTTLAVYEGCEGDPLACNDDYAMLFESQIDDLLLEAGHTYMIRIAGYQGASGDYVLHITGPTCMWELTGDSNKDCMINLADFVSLADQWLQDNIQP